MKYLGFITLLVVLFALIACQPQGPTFKPEDEAAIREGCGAWFEAAQNGDWEAVAALYSDDALFMPPNHAPLKGRANIQAFLETMPESSDWEYEIVEVYGSGDLGYLYGNYSVVIHIPGMDPLPDSGKFVEIHKKQADGSWPYYRDIFNSSVELPQ
jgi:uncharacterized protein (TIGR02246 family)